MHRRYDVHAGQPISDAAPGCAEQERRADGVVLSLMFHGRSWPWNMDEIARGLAASPPPRTPVCRLNSAGLVHRHGDFVFPTRTARRAAEIRSV
jgi:hypothetical protein